MTDWFAHKILGLPELAASSGQPVDDLMVYVHWLMLVLFVGWIAYFGYVLWRFSEKRVVKADYEGSKSKLPSYVELVIVVVEAVLLLGFAIPIWANSVEYFPKPEDSTVVQIMAEQFRWNARYPGLDKHFGSQDMKLITTDNVFGIAPADPLGKDDVQVVNGIHVVVN